MSRQPQKILPPTITEALLADALSVYLNSKRASKVVQTYHSAGNFKTKVKALDRSLRSLQSKFEEFTTQEQEALFSQVFPIDGQGIKLFSGGHTEDTSWGTFPQPRSTAERFSENLNAAISELYSYETLSGLSGRPSNESEKQLTQYLLNYWLEQTGLKPTFAKDNYSKDKKDSALILWVKQCVKKLLALCESESDTETKALLSDLRSFNFYANIEAVVWHFRKRGEN